MAEPPPHFTVVFETDIDGGAAVEVAVSTADAPLGAARLYELVEDTFFDEAAFFRVVPGFVLQFGISADPDITACWKDEALRDEARVLSNTAGTLAFATSGPHTRTTQLFFNLADNSEKLDDKGFTPVGTITGGFESLAEAVNPTPGDKSGVDQAEYEEKGNDWLLAEHPGVNKVLRAYIK
eukprot:TRINITY_DN32313_c0_g1_i1.p1 TRINITY_DN32313_c0_g1~~TRINITY_DN32313_c0_g1_i1.p1  ORF type:complete len:201 (+),score=83.98 TRINITY_DN32313_c0_g1_i1:62-604(+)